VLRLKPDYAEAHNNLGVALSQLPVRSSEAIAHFEAALRIQPDYADAHYNLGVALSQIPGGCPRQSPNGKSPCGSSRIRTCAAP